MLQTIIVTLAVRVNEIHWLLYASFIALKSHIQQYIKMMKTNLTCYTHIYIHNNMWSKTITGPHGTLHMPGKI